MPLTALHWALSAELVPLAGYSMPISYPDGIIAEHHHTRSRAGLCDVSHMGQVVVAGDAVPEQLESGGPPVGYPGAAESFIDSLSRAL